MPPAKKTDTAAATPLAKRSTRVKDSAYVAALMEYCNILFRGGFCPKGCDRPEKLFAIIEVGRDVGLPDSQAISSISIINGKASIYGDAVMGLINASGLLDYCYESFDGEGDDFAAVVRIKRKGAGQEERVQRYRVRDAKQAKLWEKDGPWTTNPKRMLRWRALGFAARDTFPDVLCGLTIFEDEVGEHEIVPIDVSKLTAPVAVPEEEQAGGPVVKFGPFDVIVADDTVFGPTEEQAAELTRIRSLVIAAKVGNPNDNDAIKAAWLSALEPFGVVSARELPQAIIDDVIADMVKDHDMPGQSDTSPTGQPANPTTAAKESTSQAA